MKRIYLWIFLLFAGGNMVAQEGIAAYEYWIDNNYTNKQSAQIAPVQTFNWQTAIPCSDLAVGIHVFNARFRDEKGQWSPAVSSYFYKYFAEESTDNKIVRMEYWLDGNYGNKTIVPATESSVFQWQAAIDGQGLTPGVHTFNVRFQDKQGYWSPSVSSYFYCKADDGINDNSIVAYEYWIDDKYAECKRENAGSESVFTFSDAIPFINLEPGIHCFHIRFKDKYGKWSGVDSRYFYQKQPDLLQNTLVAYEYWLNDDYDDKQTVAVNNQQSLIILSDFDIHKATKATNTIRFRFKDELGQWSNVYTNEFWRPVEPEFSFIAGLSEVTFTNTSKYADKYKWDFGDGYTSEQVNPAHTYKPGVYQVKLIAQNKEFTDSVLQSVEIEGIRAIVSNRGGNAGFVTANIYGGGLNEQNIVKLVNDDETIEAHTVYKKEPGVICATFDLTEKAVGVYDVIVTSQNYEYTLTNGFTVVEYVQPEIELATVSTFVHRAGTPQTFELIVKNLGNIDAYDVPVSILVSDNNNSTRFYDNQDNELFEPQPFISNIPANSERVVKYKIVSNAPSFTLKIALVNLFEKGDIENDAFNCLFSSTAAVDNVILTPAYLNPVWLCAHPTIKNQIATVRNNSQNAWDPWQSHLYNWLSNIGDAASDCGLAYANTLTPWKWLKKLETAKTLYEPFNNDFTNCIDYLFKYNHLFTSNLVKSVDPNEIAGTAGYGEQNYIQKKSHLNYTIHFENDAEQATAPAQEIVLTDTLDLTKFNPEDFSFGTFTFRDITVEAIPNVTEFSKDVDMRDRGEDIIVRISATFDKVTGIIRWYMVALDPETMDLTENPLLGILHPNKTPPIGEGNVTYRIGVKSDLPDGTVIENQAHITFDLNEPIATNVYVNTFDFSAPQSRMNTAYEIVNDTSIVVSWLGSDTGSGIRSYTVYVSENEQAYHPWLVNTTETGATFEGHPESKYQFYTTAIDNVGNMESKNEAAELEVIVPSPSKETVETPVASVPSGSTVAKNTEVSLFSATEGATIHYTIDGSSPSGSIGFEYIQPIVITEDITLKAIATKEGMTDSEIAVFEYQVDIETGIIQSPKKTLTIYVRNQTLFIKGLAPGEQYTVYSVLGNAIIQGSAVDKQEQQIALPSKGIFIVSTSDTKTKVLVE